MKGRTKQLIRGLRHFRQFTPKEQAFTKGNPYRLGKAATYRMMRSRIGSKQVRKNMKGLG